MKTKTPLQQLIETLELQKDAALDVAKRAKRTQQSSEGADAMYTAFSIAIREADKLREVEKQCFVDFGTKMQELGDSDESIDLFAVGFVFDPEQYFEETFKAN